MRRLALGLLALAAAAPAPALGFALEPAYRPVVDAAVARGFEGVVLATDATDIRCERAVGKVDRAKGREHRTVDRWPLASVTKQVVATLMRQELAGRLWLRADVDFGEPWQGKGLGYDLASAASFA